MFLKKKKKKRFKYPRYAFSKKKKDTQDMQSKYQGPIWLAEKSTIFCFIF